MTNLDRAVTTTIVFLGLAFAVFFVVPFAGLIDRALKEPDTWELLNTSEVRQALTRFESV